LDFLLGKNEENTYKKAELKSFLQFHRQAGEEPLRDDEISILNGVLSLNDKKVSTIMTDIRDVMTLSADTILDHHTVDAILTNGFSRLPVHDIGKPTSFIGLLLIKKLLKYDPAACLPVNSFPLSILPEAGPDVNCFQALDYFQTGRSHLLLISTNPGQPIGALGVVTLEDIIEEIISEEIVDETDQYESNQTKRRAKRQSTTDIMKGIVEREKRRNSYSSKKGQNGGGLAAAGPYSNSHSESSSYRSTYINGAAPGSSADGPGISSKVTPIDTSRADEVGRLDAIAEARSIASKSGSGSGGEESSSKIGDLNGGVKTGVLIEVDDENEGENKSIVEPGKGVVSESPPVQ